MILNRKAQPQSNGAIKVYSPERKDRRASIQILDYNIARVENLEDKKGRPDRRPSVSRPSHLGSGLELIVLGTLLSYLDLSGSHAESPTTSTNDGKKSDVAGKAEPMRKVPSNAPSQPAAIERSVSTHVQHYL